MGEEGIAQLIGIGGAHRRHRVGDHDAAFQQVDVTVKGDGAVVEPAVMQPEDVLQRPAPVAPLILDVVHGEHGADAAVELVARGLVADVDGHQRALPVVAVHHVGLFRQGGQKLGHGTAEEGKALGIVIAAVEVGALEVVLVVDKVPRHTVALERKQPAVHRPPRHAHIHPALKVQRLAPAFSHRLIKRQDDAHVVAVGGQRGRQTSRHVGKSAGFAEGNGLGGHIQNVHMLLLSLLL